jgi:glucose-1-phosphate cytidylyltransferase
MKVVLFCGGMGTRIRDLSGDLPKPLVAIGNRPILWHIMKYYAHFGHKDFILCLGYKGEEIKKFFLSYDPCLSSDFTMSGNGKQVHQNGSDISDWKITFVDTGLKASIGQRLKSVEGLLEGEDIFLANYADALSDMHLPGMIERFRKSGKTAGFICVKPSQSFHVVTLRDGEIVTGVRHVKDSGLIINGGCFILKKSVFGYIRPGEDLVAEPFARLIQEGQLFGHRYDGFWYCMDTFKEHQELSDMYEAGNAPWEVWKRKA